MDFKSLLKECHLHHYCNIYNLPDYKKFVLLIESDDNSLNFKVFSGETLFMKVLHSDVEIAEMQKKANTTTLSATLHWLRRKLDNAEISLVSSASSAVLHIGENKNFCMEMNQSDQAHCMLFSLATLAHQLQKENQSLQIHNEKLENEKISKDHSNHSSASPNKKSLITGNKVAKKGMSIVNPTNRKRKVAKGLQFDDDDD